MTVHEKPAADNREALTTIYQEICTSYHAIDIFRARLLGLLPLASGTGIFLLLGTGFFTQQAVFLLPIGLLGVGATSALFTLELRGIQKCRALIKAGKELEGERYLNLPHHFAKKPPAVKLLIPDQMPPALKFLDPYLRDLRSRTDALEGAEGTMGIDEGLAAQVMYPSVLSAWLFVALVGCINILFALAGVHEASSEGDAILAVMVILAVTLAFLSFCTLFRITGQIFQKMIDRDPMNQQ
jgi:hypothetical protein